MAYDIGQQRIMAREVARAGGRIAPALIRLRTEFETFRTLGQTTLRRYAQRGDFKRLVRQESKLIEKAQREAAVVVERERSEAEILPGILGRLRRDEAILNDLREKIEQRLQELDITAAVRLYRDLCSITDRRRREALPVVGTTPDAERLIHAVVNVLESSLGAARSVELMEKMRNAYRALRA